MRRFRSLRESLVAAYVRDGLAVQVCVCVEVRRAGGGRERGGRVSGEAVQVCVAVRGAGGRGERRGG